MRRVACLLLLAGLVACERTPVTLHAPDQLPESLADWGLMHADGSYLSLHESVHLYALNTPLFSDYALKLRTIWLPEGKQAAFREHGTLDFPVGTIISKTFFYEKAPDFGPNRFAVLKTGSAALPESDPGLDLERYVLLETRLLVRYDDGWKAIPYVWNRAQDSAQLAIAGDVIDIEHVTDSTTDAFTYLVPDVNQCSGCHVVDHSSKRLQPIGPSAWQLNRNGVAASVAHNQLQAWAAAGWLADLPEALPAGIDWTDPAHSLEQRARAYLDSNCAHCHNDKGAADTSALDLTIDAVAGRQSGICKPPVAVGRGSGDRPYDIFPGHPEKSILLYRMQETAPEIAMPELGRSTVHTEAVTLIGEWIASLDEMC